MVPFSFILVLLSQFVVLWSILSVRLVRVPYWISRCYFLAEGCYLCLDFLLILSIWGSISFRKGANFVTIYAHWILTYDLLIQLLTSRAHNVNLLLDYGTTASWSAIPFQLCLRRILVLCEVDSWLNSPFSWSSFLWSVPSHMNLGHFTLLIALALHSWCLNALGLKNSVTP
jgi:hypothetical protein